MRNTCSWGVGLAKTFRNKSGKLFNLIGSNMQNPSERVCRIHIPDSGKNFIQADQSGAEDLIFAFEARPGRKRQIFEYGIKPHCYTALHLFSPKWKSETPYDAAHLAGLPIPDLANHPDWKVLSKIIKDNYKRYFLGKKTGHSYNYGKGASSFRFDILKESEGKIVLSLQESEIFEALYHGLYPEVKEEQCRIEEQIRKTRILYNLFGYPMYFGGSLVDKVIREGIAWKFQSTVGIIASNGFRDIQNYIEEGDKNWDVLNNKHDSVLIQAPEDESLEAAKALHDVLAVPLTSTRGESFRMKVEVSIGKNWDKYDKEKNPDGMKEISL